MLISYIQSNNLVKAIDQGNLDNVIQSLKEGADPNSADQDGDTALMYAVGEEHESIVNELLAAGADPNRFNISGQNALICCAIIGHESILNKLLAAGADLDAQRDLHGYTALMNADYTGDCKGIIAKLLKAGADPNIHGMDGCTALSIAVSAKNKPSIYLLLQAGASLKCAPDKNIFDYDSVKIDPEIQKFIIDILGKRIQARYKSKQQEAEEFAILKDLATLDKFKDNPKLKETIKLFHNSAIKQITGVLGDAEVPLFPIKKESVAKLQPKVKGTTGDGKEIYELVQKEVMSDVAQRSLDPIGMESDPNHTLAKEDVANIIYGFLSPPEFNTLVQTKKPYSKSQPKDLDQNSKDIQSDDISNIQGICNTPLIGEEEIL